MKRPGIWGINSEDVEETFEEDISQDSVLSFDTTHTNTTATPDGERNQHIALEDFIVILKTLKGTNVNQW